MLSTIHIAVSLIILAFGGSAAALGPAPVIMNSAGNFAILAKAGVSTVPSSIITGNVGVSPIASTAMTGFSLVADSSGTFWTSAQVKGDLMGASDAPPTPAILSTAVGDMEKAYIDAIGRAKPDFSELGAGSIGSLILLPGLYKWTNVVNIATDITLVGSARDTWIFQISGTLSQAAGSHVKLSGGALSKNIVWAVAGEVSIGVGATFEGTLLAQTSVAILTGATHNGCIYSQTAVALQMATILCSLAIPPTPVSPQCFPTATSTPCVSVEFEDLTGAIQSPDDDYLGFTLVASVDDCLESCRCTSGCEFANSYHDDGGKNSTQLTCSLYGACHTADEATNFGQVQPDGSFSTISSSDGYCFC